MIEKYKKFLYKNEMLQHYINWYLSIIIWDERMKKERYQKVIKDIYLLLEKNNQNFLSYLDYNYRCIKNFNPKDVLEWYSLSWRRQ